VHFYGIRATFGEDVANLSGVRDKQIFLMLLGRPRSSAFGEDAYPELEDKAAALAEGIIRAQAFVDGNKRTGILAGMVMLRANGRAPIAESTRLYQVAIDIERGAMTLADLADWMRDWENVLPVTEEEWQAHPRLFDTDAWAALGASEEE
jgi:death-on-curing protein